MMTQQWASRVHYPRLIESDFKAPVRLVLVTAAWFKGIDQTLLLKIPATAAIVTTAPKYTIFEDFLTPIRPTFLERIVANRTGNRAAAWLPSDIEPVRRLFVLDLVHQRPVSFRRWWVLPEGEVGRARFLRGLFVLVGPDGSILVEWSARFRKARHFAPCSHTLRFLWPPLVTLHLYISSIVAPRSVVVKSGK